MTDKNPQTYSPIIYATVIAFSMLGAVAHFLQEEGLPKTKGKVTLFFIDVTVSPITGVLTFYLCEAINMPLLGSIAVSGLCSHMGTRGFVKIRNALIKRYFNVDIEE